MHETKAITVTEVIKREHLGIGVELGTAGPVLTFTSPEEQMRNRIRVHLKAMRIGRLERPEERGDCGRCVMMVAGVRNVGGRSA